MDAAKPRRLRGSDGGVSGGLVVGGYGRQADPDSHRGREVVRHQVVGRIHGQGNFRRDREAREGARSGARRRKKAEGWDARIRNDLAICRVMHWTLADLNDLPMSYYDVLVEMLEAAAQMQEADAKEQ